MTPRLAYLCGEYPRATDTFIQREVAALRRAGLPVETISVRRPAQREQGSEEQRQERENTHYLLPCSPWRLLADHARLLFSTPVRYCRGVGLALTVRAPGLRALIYQLFYFAEAGLLAQRMRQRGLTHIHNHAPDASGYVTMLAAQLGNLTYSLTLHGFGILSEPSRWRLQDKIKRSLFTIGVSKHARSQAMLWSDRSCWDRLHVVHCGIVPQQTAPDTVRQHAGRGKRLLFVGRFDHVKGLPVLLEAFALIAANDPEVHLDLVGDGPERPDLEALVREKGLEKRVMFPGYRSQEELEEYFSRADVFVITSFAEGIPVVLMEAMSRGVPVVAPRITGIPELVEEGINGLLTAPADIDDLVRCLSDLLYDPNLRNRLAAEGRRKVEEHFNINTETGRLVKIMRSYLKDHPDNS